MSLTESEKRVAHAKAWSREQWVKVGIEWFGVDMGGIRGKCKMLGDSIGSVWNNSPLLTCQPFHMLLLNSGEGVIGEHDITHLLITNALTRINLSYT